MDFIIAFTVCLHTRHVLEIARNSTAVLTGLVFPPRVVTAQVWIPGAKVICASPAEIVSPFERDATLRFNCRHPPRQRWTDARPESPLARRLRQPQISMHGAAEHMTFERWTGAPADWTVWSHCSIINEVKLTGLSNMNK